jgi:hypothetical protein
MKRLALAVLALTALSAPAPAAGQREFHLPSDNIGCIYTPDGGTPTYHTKDNLAEIACDRIEPKYVRVVLGRKLLPVKYTKVGDASCCGGRLLRYGRVFRAGPFVCRARTTGLTCTRSIHGLFMSRKRIATY